MQVISLPTRLRLLLSVLITGAGITAAFANTPQCVTPTAGITGSTILCTANSPSTYSSTTLTAAGGTTYAWSNGGTTAANTVSAPGTYTVTVSVVGGCTATAAVTVTSISPTSGGTIGYDETGCGTSYDPALIQNITAASGQPAGYSVEYVWITTTDPATVAGTASNMTLITGATGSSYDPPVISQTTWYRRCSRTVGCTGSYSAESQWIKKDIKPAPSVTATNVGNRISPE